MRLETTIDGSALPPALTRMPTDDFGAIRFAGYAALFDTPDAGRDVIRKGAFARSLAQRRLSGEAVPLLWQHRPDQRIGWVERITEDDRGLRIVARIDHPNSMAAKLLRKGSLSGLSFGYRTGASSSTRLEDGGEGRELQVVDLFEVSLVTRPMQHGARAHFVT